jgi:hypothetical protein
MQQCASVCVFLQLRALGCNGSPFGDAAEDSTSAHDQGPGTLAPQSRNGLQRLLGPCGVFGLNFGQDASWMTGRSSHFRKWGETAGTDPSMRADDALALRKR